MQLWDIGGQTLTSKMAPSFIHGSHAILLAYDITSYQVQRWELYMLLEPDRDLC